MNTLYFIFVSLIPALLIIFIFYFLDKNKEPVKMVLKAFLWGMVSVIITIMTYIIIPGSGLEPDGGLYNALIVAFYDAALHEELAKLFVIIIGIYRMKDFDEWYDGMLYGIAVGTGFAFIENIEYFFDYYYAIGSSIFVSRNTMPLALHTLAGGIMGYYVAKAKFTKVETKQIEYWIAALFVPFVFHGAYDFILMFWDIKLEWFAIPILLYMFYRTLKFKKEAQTSVIE